MTSWILESLVLLTSVSLIASLEMPSFMQRGGLMSQAVEPADSMSNKKLHLLYQAADTLPNFLHCTNPNSSFVDPYIGEFSIDQNAYCDPGCLRSVRGVTCCPPQSPDTIDVTFKVFAPSAKRVELNWKQVNKEKSPLPSGKDVVFLVHGWLESEESSSYMTPIKDGWNARDRTVVMVDWRHGNAPVYTQAYANVRVVGAMVGQAILNWKCAQKTLLIGFSLGGHIIGEAGKYVKAHGQEVAECHGLDPAGPFFTGCSDKIILDRSDCRLVQVIHSSSEHIVNTGLAGSYFGTFHKGGHCDFWINCGHEQSCPDARFEELLAAGFKMGGMSDSEIRQYLRIAACAHHRAAQTYMFQLNGDCDYEVRTCDDCGPEITCTPGKIQNQRLPPDSDCNPNMNISYHVATNSVEPFCSVASQETSKLKKMMKSSKKNKT